MNKGVRADFLQTNESKLNASNDVLKKSAAFAAQKGGISGFELTIPRVFKIIPQAGKAQLVAVTLPRSKSMGFSATVRGL